MRKLGSTLVHFLVVLDTWYPWNEVFPEGCTRLNTRQSGC